MGLFSSAASWHYQWLLLVPHISAVSVLADDLFALPLLLLLLSSHRAQHFLPLSVCLSYPALLFTLPQAVPSCHLPSSRILSQILSSLLGLLPPYAFFLLSPQVYVTSSVFAVSPQSYFQLLLLAT